MMVSPHARLKSEKERQAPGDRLLVLRGILRPRTLRRSRRAGRGVGQWESCNIKFDPTGSVTVHTGSHSHGQGHETVYAQIISEHLGVPFESVEVSHGDTGSVPFGMGTYGSRSGRSAAPPCSRQPRDRREGQEDRRSHAGVLSRRHFVRGRHLSPSSAPTAP